MNIKLLITIVSRGIATDVAEVLYEHGLTMNCIMQGMGTASSEIRHMLGLGTSEKELVLTVAPQEQLRKCLPVLNSRLHLPRAGHGIAFTVPLSAVSSSTLKRAMRDLPNDSKEETSMSNEYTHDLIIAMVDSEQSDVAFAAAKEAGCRGGTIIKGRQVRGEDAKKLFGMTIQPEKEVLLILVPSADKTPILKAIVNKVLQTTGEHVVAFTLPVADVMGLTDYDLMKDDTEIGEK